jgi:cysteinyl-tRNA synthetase
MRVVAVLSLVACLAGCAAEPQAPPSGGPGRGFPSAGPWVSFYGQPDTIDLTRVAASFRIINIDADPVGGNVTADQVATLRDGGRNRVLSYLNLGAIERTREYWGTVPAGFLAPAQNTKAQLGPYAGYPDEVWMDPSDPNWRKVLVDHVAPRLAAQGVDGFYFDNLDVVEQEPGSGGPLCDPGCAQGALDLVGALRVKYPRLLFVMQNATGDVTRRGRAGGASFASVLDGIAHEEVFSAPRQTGSDARDAVYEVRTDPVAVGELTAWRELGLKPGARPLWIGTLDYVNTCGNTADAAKVRAAARAQRFEPYVSDKSASQATVCFP